MFRSRSESALGRSPLSMAAMISSCSRIDCWVRSRLRAEIVEQQRQPPVVYLRQSYLLICNPRTCDACRH
jgi:hypothetical protein